MEQFNIKVKEVLQRDVPIAANTVEEAIDLVNLMYDREDIVLDDTDFIGVASFIADGTTKEEILIAYDASVILPDKAGARHVSNTAVAVVEYKDLQEFGKDYQHFKNEIKNHIKNAVSTEFEVNPKDLYVSFEVYEIIGRRVIDE